MRPAISALILGTLIACAAFALVLLRLDPHSGPTAPVAFFATLFLALTGAYTLAVILLRLWIKGNELLYRSLGLAFREGMLLSATTVLLLVLQAFRRLTWWAVLIVVVVSLLAELALHARLSLPQDSRPPRR